MLFTTKKAKNVPSHLESCADANTVLVFKGKKKSPKNKFQMLFLMAFRENLNAFNKIKTAEAMMLLVY